jgi:hypothetical protein
MTRYRHLDSIKEILLVQRDDSLVVSKMGTMKLLRPHLLALHDLGVNYVQITVILNAQDEWITVDTLRSYMSRIRSSNLATSKHNVQITEVTKVDTVTQNIPDAVKSPEATHDVAKTTSDVGKSSLPITNPGKDACLDIQKENSNRVEKIEPFASGQTTYPKYDRGLSKKPLTKAELGLPE